MDEREIQEKSEGAQDSIFPEEKNLENGWQDGEKKKRRRKTTAIAIFVVIAIILVIAITVGYLWKQPAKGYTDYVIQKEQYFVEYSEEYDYWDVITVEYPKLEGIDEEIQVQLNQLMYDTAMDRVYYWHLDPSDEVKDFQKEFFSIFCSDVNCDVTFHSQYLLSMDFNEYYSAGNPVWMTNGTERTLTLNLVTGQNYALSDIIKIDNDFIRLWDKAISDELQQEYAGEDEIPILLSWFQKEDAEINKNYFCNPFFYIDENQDFVIGFSLDPILECAYTYEPTNRSYYTKLNAEDLATFKTESDFWDLYEKSVTAGEVLPCEDKKENLWLGKGAGIWQHEY